MIKCVLFDLDGTILNTLPTITYYLNRALTENGLPGIDEEECRRCVGNGSRNLIRRVAELRGVSDPVFLDKLHREYNLFYDAEPYYLTSPYPEIVKVLEELKSRGIMAAVLSNKPDFAARSLVTKYFDGFFVKVRGGRDGAPLKPSAEAVTDFLSELRISNGECAFVGDSEVDVKTAKNADLPLCVAVSWGFRPREMLADADFIADTADELLGNLISN